MFVAIGSTNPCKISAVQNVFFKIWPQTEFVASEVNSAVSAQPIGEKQIIQGAINRAKKALKKNQADFSVGIEGGVRKIKNSLFSTAWCAVINKRGKISTGGGLIMPLPKLVSQEILKGKELGEVMDKITGIKNVKKKMGATGVFTKNLVPREQAYEQIVAFALVKFLNPEIYQTKA